MEFGAMENFIDSCPKHSTIRYVLLEEVSFCGAFFSKVFIHCKKYKTGHCYTCVA